MQLDAIIADYLRTTSDDDSRKENVLEICQLISLRKLTLVDFVSALGEYLTEDDSTIRSRSMQLLQRVIGGIPLDALSGQHISVINQFFCNRLSDAASLGESLTALISISKMSRFAEADVHLTARSIFELTPDVQQRPQRLRYQIYTLLEGMMATKRAALKSFGSPFLTGFTALMEGEKDPRNLMVAFSIAKVILQEFDIVSHVVDLFDVLYCYFPITFRPPPDNSTSITTDDLKERLRDCLSASHYFASYLVPALLEKLHAVAVSVKKDTLLTLTACSRLYSAATMDPYVPQLWAALKFEIIQAEDNLLEEIALESMTAITKCLARGLKEMPRQGILSRWLQRIVTEALEELKQPELKSAKPCGKIIKSTAIASGVCLQVVSKAVLPGLLALCDETQDKNRSASLLEVLGCLLEAACIAQGESAKEESSCLGFMREDLVEQVSKHLHRPHIMDLDLTMAALVCSSLLFRIKLLLNDLDRRKIVNCIDDLAVNGDQEIAEQAIETLASLSIIKADLILECTLPVLLAKLPSDDVEAPELNNRKEPKELRTILDALARLSQHKVIFETVIVRLLSRLDSSLLSDPTEATYPSQLLSTIRQVLRHYSRTPGDDPAIFYTKLIPQIFQRTFAQRDTVLSTPELLSISSEIVNLICRQLSLEQQRSLAADLFSLYLTGGINNLVRHVDSSYSPLFSASVPPPQRNTVALFVGAYSGLRQELDIITSLNTDFLSTIVQSLNTSTNEIQRVSFLRLACLLINKCGSETQVSAAIESLTSSVDFSDPRNGDLLLWTCKALILRSHKTANGLIDQVLSQLASEQVGGFTARAFQVLIGDDALISVENHCIIKRLHKQKFYASVVPVLMQKLAHSSAGKTIEPFMHKRF